MVGATDSEIIKSLNHELISIEKRISHLDVKYIITDRVLGNFEEIVSKMGCNESEPFIVKLSDELVYEHVTTPLQIEYLKERHKVISELIAEYEHVLTEREIVFILDENITLD